MYRYNPAVKKLIEMVKNGELGAIQAINAEMSIWHKDEYRAWLDHFPGGDMYIFGSHLIDLIVYLMGKPNKVLSSIVSSGRNGVKSPDVTAAILEYDNAIARVFSSSLEWDGWARRCFSVAGEKGTAHIQPIEAPCIMTFAQPHPDRRAGVQKAEPVDGIDPNMERDDAYDYMLCDFRDYVLGTKKNPFSYEHDYAVQEVLLQACGGVACREIEGETR